MCHRVCFADVGLPYAPNCSGNLKKATTESPKPQCQHTSMISHRSSAVAFGNKGRDDQYPPWLTSTSLLQGKIPLPLLLTSSILQVNVCGLQPRKTDLEKMLSENDVRIALIQETILPSQSINNTGYTKYQCNCNTNCQGIMTLVRNDTEAKVLNLTTTDVDLQKIKTWDRNKKKELTIFNTYWPPGSKNDLPFQESTFTKTIIAGDLNAHSPTWGYNNLDGKGKQIEALCNGSNMVLMQNEQSLTKNPNAP